MSTGFLFLVFKLIIISFQKRTPPICFSCLVALASIFSTILEGIPIIFLTNENASSVLPLSMISAVVWEWRKYPSILSALRPLTMQNHKVNSYSSFIVTGLGLSFLCGQDTLTPICPLRCPTNSSGALKLFSIYWILDDDSSGPTSAHLPWYFGTS